MTKREIENKKIEEVYERFKNASVARIKMVYDISRGHHSYLKKGLNKVLKERGIKEI